MTAWPPTRISSSLEVSAHDVAMNVKCFRYLKINSVCLGLRSSLVLSLKSLDTAGGIHQFLFARKEGMALRTDFQMNFRLRRSRPKRFATGALDDRIDVIRMYVGFHWTSSQTIH